MDNLVKLHAHNSITNGNLHNHKNDGRCGNYILLRVLGKGGFATTYLGWHIYLGTLAAIKVLHPHLHEEERQHFLREARTIANIRHPHVVPVLDFDMGPAPYLIMAYAPFGTLRERHPYGTQLSPETVLVYVKQIARALQHLHTAHIIHGDIKPENLLIGPDKRILLSDFGVATYVENDDAPSPNRGGTFAYMAPECFSGQAFFASDQYALGVLVYEWLCGERPFMGTKAEIEQQHIQEQPVSLRELAPTVPPTVEAVVMRALAKQRAQRFPSVEAFARALEDAIASTGLYAAKPTIIPQRSARRDTQASTRVGMQGRGTQNGAQQRRGHPIAIAPAPTKRRTAMISWQALAKLFGIDMLIGSAVFVVLALLGFPTHSPWFYAFLCLGGFPLMAAVWTKNKLMFFCASGMLLVASVVGVAFQSQIVFASVYLFLFLLCLFVALAVANRQPKPH